MPSLLPCRGLGGRGSLVSICAGSVGFVTTTVGPYLGLGGDARQVMARYRVLLGGRTVLGRVLNL